MAVFYKKIASIYGTLCYITVHIGIFMFRRLMCFSCSFFRGIFSPNWWIEGKKEFFLHRQFQAAFFRGQNESFTRVYTRAGRLKGKRKKNLRNFKIFYGNCLPEFYRTQKFFLSKIELLKKVSRFKIMLWGEASNA